MIGFKLSRALITCALAITASAGTAAPPRIVPYGPELEGFDYPHPVKRFALTSQRQSLSMAYMDIAAPAGSGKGVVVLLHGKNFCGATWADTIAALHDAGWRVVVPDQIGFCKSSKPASYQFSFHQLAANTRALLSSLSIDNAIVIGHSMGGMLAVRYALMYPQATTRLMLVNPLGLEDWKADGVPYKAIDAAYATELNTSYDTIKQYQLTNYYSGAWQPRYDRWVDMLAGMYAGKGRELVAWNQALTSDMLYTQPVVYEFQQVQPPTVLFIGGRDRTAPGKDGAPPAIAARLGNYPELGRSAAKLIPHATIVEFPDLGHSPQVEDPEEFHKALLASLAANPPS